MNIGKIIVTKRKELNMTQEQLAKKLGVSVPAVSKWETNASLPDINLLPPIARIFNISIDALLNFKSDLTEVEIRQITNDMKKRIEKGSIEDGIKYGEEMLRRYPNSDKLHLEIAVNIFVSSNMEALETGDSTALSEYRERAMKICEGLMHSDDVFVSNAAKTMTASHYMGVGRLDEAESIFKQMEYLEEWNSKRILPVVYTLKEEYDKALTVSEENLMSDLGNLFTDIRSIYNVALKTKDYERALKIGEVAKEISNCFKDKLNNGLEMVLGVYLERGEKEKALAAFEDYIDNLIEYELDYKNKHTYPFFREKSIIKQMMGTVNILEIIYKAISMDNKYDDMRELDSYKKSMDKLYRAIKA